MNEPNVIDAPWIDPTNSTLDPQWRREHDAFVRLLPELLKSVRGKFVAVHAERVVAVADTFSDAAMKAYEQIGYVPLHVGQVSEIRPNPVRLPSSRITTLNA